MKKGHGLSILGIALVIAPIWALITSSHSSHVFSFSKEDLLSRATAAVTPSRHSKAALGKKAASFKAKNWGLDNGLQLGSSFSHINALKAWEIEKGSRDVIVAVIDTGIDPTHPDLKVNIWRGKPTLKAPKNLDKVFGWDFSRNRPNPKDDHGHGTHVAGIIGAVVNPKSGTSGVAQRVSIMAVKYYAETNPGPINLSNGVRALHYAIDNGADIINYSGGGPEYSQEEYTAIKRAESLGILIVAAAGNNHENIDLQENHYFPSSYDLENIISVAATNIKNELLPSSNWGSKGVDVAAPGENIYSTLPGRKYGYMSGTSQATAFVSGLAALIKSKNPALTAPQIKSVITSSVDRIPALKGRLRTAGRVNAHQALVAATKIKPFPKSTRHFAQKKEESRKAKLLRLLASPVELLKRSD